MTVGERKKEKVRLSISSSQILIFQHIPRPRHLQSSPRPKVPLLPPVPTCTSGKFCRKVLVGSGRLGGSWFFHQGFRLMTHASSSSGSYAQTLTPTRASSRLSYLTLERMRTECCLRVHHSISSFFEKLRTCSTN